MYVKKSSDPRLNDIHSWLDTIFNSSDYQLESASSDASFRRYFRVLHHDKTWILMDAPPANEDTGPFIDIATFLFTHGINVPEVKAKDSQLGLLLLSDFGSTPYLDELNADPEGALYHPAIDSLISIQQCPLKENLPLYDRALLQQEMMLFPEWFLDKHLGIPAPTFLQTTFNILIDNALEQPQVFVHRDYHSRNLMHTTENTPGIIDFQDAVIGPITYDLVSLLRDCYISWPEDKLTQWIQYYLGHAHQQGLLNGVSIEQFTRWFDLMGLQRHIKVLGIFCRLHYRDNKDNYLNDLPLTLHYVQKISRKYPEFSDLSNFLSQQRKIANI
ncbi:MAG: phosphotransferase [Gammaproteobacteria bacterium]|nr:phosphotransferase [Gammaproteobacteria bacterium]